MPGTLSASCPKCGAPFDEMGHQMRAGYDNWGEFCTGAAIAMQLEEALDATISDAELKGAQTLRDIACVVRARMPASDDSEAQVIELVRAAARKVRWCSAIDVDLDVPMMDAVHPDRWNKT